MSSQLQVTGEAKIRDIQGPVVANSGVITALDGAASQYVRGDGTLADFPTSTGGGSSVSYYLNSSVSQGTIGGVAYRELSKEPIIGGGTDITISANGYVANYITDANDPDVLSVPGGNFNCEFYFSVNNNTGSPTTYAELYKYDGTTFTLLGSSQAVPESLNQGTTIAPYYFAIPVATAALALTDRLAIRIYVSVDGRVVTLHTENSHLCQVVTTFSKGMVSLNNLTDQSQFITTGTSGTNFNIVSSGDTHTFNLPVASATNTGKLSNTDWSTFNNKQAALSFTAPLVNTSNTISIPAATSLVDGYLDNLDWVNFNTAYNNMIVSAAVTGTTTKTLTLTQQDAGTITASWTDDNTDAVTSVFGRTGAVVATSGDYTTTQVTEGTNLYFTNARAQSAITGGASTITTSNLDTSKALSSNSSGKVVTSITTATELSYLSGVSSNVQTQLDGKAATFTLGSVSSSPTSVLVITGSGAPVNGSLTFTINQSSSSQNGYLSSTDWSTFNNKQGAITLTTTGTSGAATLVGNTLNIPNYTPDLSGYVTIATTQTITGTKTFSEATRQESGLLLKNGVLAGATGYASLGGASNGLVVQLSGSANQQTLIFQSGAAYSYTLPATSGTLALTSQIPANPVTGSGTTNTLPKFTAASTIGNSNITDTGSLITLGSNSYVNGALGIGTFGLTGYNLRIGGTITGLTTSYGIYNSSVIQSDVTISGIYNRTVVGTASSVTVTNIFHYAASQGTFGAGSVITNQYGYNVDSTLIGATNNYGFRGAIPSGANRWNLFMDGTAENYLAGNTGIGGVAAYISSGPILTSTLTNGGSGYVDGTYTDVATTLVSSTGAGALFTIVVSGGVVTTATLTWGGIFYKVGDTITVSNILLGGAGSGLVITINTVDSSQLTIANANGGDISLLRVDTSLSSGENLGTIKFLSNDTTAKASGIEAEIGAFAAGTSGGAYLSFFTRSIIAGTSLVEAMRIDSRGGVGIGATVLVGYGLKVSKNITNNVSSYGITSDGQIQSDVTTRVEYYRSEASTVAASFTLPTIIHYRSQQGTFGAGSSVTNQYGFFADASMVGATNNYGFWGAIPSGTNRWNLYMNGTASNYLAGKLLIGSTTDSGEQLQVTGTAKITGAATFSSSVTAAQAILNTYSSNYNLRLQSNPTAIEFYNTSGLVRNWQISAQNINDNALDFTPSTAAGGTTYSTPLLSLWGSLGRVGIGTGTSSPANLLSLKASSVAPVLDITRSGGGQGKNSGILFRDQVGTEVGAIGTEGTETNDLQILSTSGIRFNTSSDLISTSERMRITSNGNVGFNTSSPNALGGYTIYTFNTESTRTTGSIIDLNISGTRYSTLFTTTGGTYFGSNQNVPLILLTNGNESARITGGGNVLIGTTTDAGQKLQVNGITKTNTISLASTTFSSSTTMTDAFFSWSFGGSPGQTLTLYNSSGHTNMHFIKNQSSISLTIAAHSGGVIMGLSSGSGSTSITLGAFKTVQLISFGGGAWYIMYQTT